MANYTDLADFSPEGFNLGKDSRVMTYLHGLSDFWVYMFEDASKINAMMEANAVTASDIYNKFLQLTSVISLEDVNTLTNSQLKLILISEDDAVQGKLETYKFPEGVDLKYARCLVNRAFLPTAKLENEADYYIDEELGQISFAQPLRGLGFPFRTLSSGKKEYAIWAIDAKVDNQVIYDYYAKLLNINPTTSTENFKNFVYGMYFLFVNGPNLETVKRGLNIALGIPLARDSESVLEIRKYLNTDQWLVITDLNSYLVPYGLAPTVAIDDVLTTGQEIASWIEVKDYEQDGEWWVNFMLPSHILPQVPPSVVGGGGVNADASPDRYMTQGSYADWLMRNYLKTHTFLVNVRTVSFKNLQTFEQLSSIIREVKPSHTTPIYVWTVPTEEEPIELVEELMKVVLERERCECIMDRIRDFRRDATAPIIRGNCPQYTRMTAPSTVNYLFGNDPETRGTPRTYRGGTSTGYIAPARTYSTLSANETAWLKTFRTRMQDQYNPLRSMVDFFRDFGSSPSGVTERPLARLFPGKRMVYLHTTTLKDVTEKFSSAGVTIPAESQYYFTLFEPETSMNLINSHAINDVVLNSYLEFMKANIDYYFKPGYYSQFLTPMFPAESKQTYAPVSSDLIEGDYMAFTRIADNCLGVFWVTTNFSAQTPPYWEHDNPDVLNVQFTAPISRGAAPLGSPFYMTRGSGVSYNTVAPITDDLVNPNFDESSEVSVTYSDDLNAPFAVNRGGVSLSISRTFK
jgi:hypothetical protein